MLVRTYRRLKSIMDRDRLRRRAGELGALTYWLRRLALRLMIQTIIFPRWLLLGPFKTFTEFARTNERGAWIDSYDEFILANRITLRGVVAIVLIALVAVVVFIYLPIIYIRS